MAFPKETKSHAEPPRRMIQRVDETSRRLGLRNLLNEWDPIGVADIAPDEYDCLIPPILARLISGSDGIRIRELVWHELEHHFGLLCP
jgi:hypothetical protein